jgi:hypothetical protein
MRRKKQRLASSTEMRFRLQCIRSALVAALLIQIQAVLGARIDKYPNCHVDRPSEIGDGYCDTPEYNTAECGWDGGDCVLKDYPKCHADDPKWIGNGYCDGGDHNTAECGWDGGDCIGFNKKYPNCHVDQPGMVGSGWCSGGEYNTAECGWDGGDCDADNAFLWKLQSYPDCNKGVTPKYVGNGACNGGKYNTAECGWDGGDCSVDNAILWATYPQCKGGVHPKTIGDGRCDGGEANTAECGWDGGDCNEQNKHKLYEEIWFPPETAKDYRVTAILCMLFPILCLIFIMVVTRSKGTNEGNSAASDTRSTKDDAVKVDVVKVVGPQVAKSTSTPKRSQPNKKTNDDDDEDTCVTKESDEEEGPWWRFNHCC